MKRRLKLKKGGLMTKKQRLLIKFKEKWQMLNRLEENEVLKLSLEQKFRQIVSLIRLAKGLRIDFSEDKEKRIVRSRWISLKNEYRAI